MAGAPPVVDDGNPCTADSCDPDGGVKHVPVIMGVVCAAANACHAAGTCGAAGQCVAGAPTSIDDGNPCTADSCSPDAGVLHMPLAAGTSCSNGNACDGGEQCSASGACVAGVPPATDDANPCTVDSCDPLTGVLHAPVAAGTSCADGNLCNGTEACSAGGVCAPGSPLVTDDANPCTADACDPLQGVSNSAVAAGTSCSDGNPCNGVEACTTGGTCVASGAPALDDGNPCTADSCDPLLGVRHLGLAAGTSCADADACNGAEVCTVAGACVPGSLPVLDDGNPCTADSCAGGSVQHLPVTNGTACSDGNLCNGLEVCRAGACVPGSLPVLDDGNVCTVDGCDPATGNVTHNPALDGTACDDATVCNGHEACQSGSCQAGTPIAVDDGNPCTADSCSPTGGVIHQSVASGTACDDATVCNGHETCSLAGQCLAGSALVLDDGNPCTTDSCSATGGVAHQLAPVGASCSDGDACNGQEQCSASGACVATSAPVIDDGNPCTVDTCSPGSGTVQHTPVAGGAACADSDLCNGNEICSGSGTCSAGTPAVVDDGNPCTVDSCDPLAGVRHLPLDTPECVGRAGWARVIGSQPSPRDGAAGVFIGTGELLLFGGDNAGAVLADAWLWSPTTRAWRRVASGPSARAGASLSFDAARQRAVLFGGVGSAAQGAQYLNDVWEYDASADAWTKRIVTGPSPAPRALAAFAFDSARARGLLFGGTNDGALSDTWEWDSAQGRWAQLSTSGPSARYGAAFAFDEATRRYALFGGSPGNATGALSDTWLLAADTGVWTAQTTPQAPPARAAAGMVFDADAQRLVLFGGTGVTSPNLEDTWELSTANGTWSALPTLAAPPATTGAVVGFDLQTRRVVVATGLSYSSSGRFTPQSSAVWLLDRVAERWTDRGSTVAPPQLRYGAAFDTNRQLIVAMGTRAPPERALMWSFDSRAAQWSVQDVTDVEHPFSAGEFNGLADSTNSLFYAAQLGVLLEVRHKELAQWDGERWTKRCDLPSVGALGSQYETSAAYDAAYQRVYLFGGGVPGSFEQLKNDVIALDVTTCTAEVLQPTTPPPPHRKSTSSTWDSDRGRLIVFGGLDYSRGPSRDTWEFDPVGRTWTALAGAMPPARSGATSVYDSARHRVILHGGRAESALLYDTWELDPASGSWRQLVTAGPSDGEQAALTFDAIRNSAALVSTRGAVWYLSGESWTADLNPVSPSARSGFSGGFGPASGVGVFFGGTSGDGQRDFLGDVWIWRDGWRGVYPGAAGSPLISHGQGSPSTRSGMAVPSGRTGHVLASGLVDTWANKDVFLLFGGEGASDKYLGLYGDTWTFDATTMEWTARSSSSGPRGRTGHAMSVLPNRGYVMFGGLGRDRFPTGTAKDILKDVSFSDTWIWESSGTYWHKVSDGGPSARYGHAMATDETANEIILFGGRDANGVSGETWRLALAGLNSTAVWQKLSPPSSPLSRFGHSMTWDPVRRRIVLTGGEGANASQSFEDTWEWDSLAQRWVLRNVSPLEGRAGHVSFFDRKRGLLLAFGGFSHREAGKFALTHGDTLAFHRPSETDPNGGFPNGSRCNSAGACVSGACADGFCCNSACTGQCGACDVPGFEGTCSPVAGAPHGARSACGSSGAECSSQCDGNDMTQCNVPPVGTPCGPEPGCSGENTLVSARGSCDATGVCVVPQVSCGNYTCCGANNSSCAANPRCLTVCQVSGETAACIGGYKCNGPGELPRGQCYKPTQVTSFTATPATAKVGVPMTFKVTASEPNTAFEYRYTFGEWSIWPTCFGPTCTWTPAAADVGKTATWSVFVGNAPGSSNSMDDSKTLTLTVQP
jgi:N-acetylneuraminic acid mutarotase